MPQLNDCGLDLPRKDLLRRQGRLTMKSVGTAVILALLLIAPPAFAASCPIARGPCSITAEF
jgi:hypothetical protein